MNPVIGDDPIDARLMTDDLIGNFDPADVEMYGKAIKTPKQDDTDPNYDSLKKVLDEAFEQASEGKGHNRHNPDCIPFTEQDGCTINKRFPGFAKGQATKKIFESEILPPVKAIEELKGAIVYLAMEIIRLQEGL